MTERACAGVNAKGEPCSVTNNVLPDGFCWFHSPTTAEKRKQTASRAGKARRKANVRVVSSDQVPEPPETLHDVVRWSSWCTWATATGAIDSGTSRQITAALGELRRALEKRDLETLGRELKAKMKELKREMGA